MKFIEYTVEYGVEKKILFVFTDIEDVIHIAEVRIREKSHDQEFRREFLRIEQPKEIRTRT